MIHITPNLLTRIYNPHIPEDVRLLLGNLFNRLIDRIEPALAFVGIAKLINDLLISQEKTLRPQNDNYCENHPDSIDCLLSKYDFYCENHPQAIMCIEINTDIYKYLYY